MQYKLVSIHTAIYKIVNDLGLGDKEVNWQSYVDWIAEVMQHIGAYNQYEQKVATLELEDGRTKLPDDFYRVVEGHKERYKIVSDTIIVDTRKSSFALNYLAFKTDENGFPLIPDHVSYMEALFWKVAMQLAMRDELPNKSFTYDYCRGKYNFYVRQARSKMSELNEQEKALFTKMFLSGRTDIAQYPHFRDVDNGRG